MIRARGLERRYGDKRVLGDLDLDLPRGGFLLVTGANGSGKTTLLRMCAGLAVLYGAATSRSLLALSPGNERMQSISGAVQAGARAYLNRQYSTIAVVHVEAERAEIGFLGHEPLVYRELTALENLDLYGRLYRVPERRERIGMLLERFGLWEARNERVGAFSRGMLQRLALCRALLHDPGLLVLDEPYSALDERGAALLDRQLEELREERTFLVATHDPARLARLASARVALVKT